MPWDGIKDCKNRAAIKTFKPLRPSLHPFTVTSLLRSSLRINECYVRSSSDKFAFFAAFSHKARLPSIMAGIKITHNVTIKQI